MAQVEASVGFKDILKILGWSQTKLYRNRDELLDAGVIFYQRIGHKMPRRRMRAFPSRIQNWIALKAKKRELL